jgi:hypothetical protein
VSNDGNMSCTTSFIVIIIIIIVIIIIIIIITIEILETLGCLMLTFKVETVLPLDGLRQQMPLSVMLVYSKDVLCPLEWSC